MSNSTAIPPGTVYLVGGGPGDPDLLTIKALRLLQQADIVVYDRLVSKEIVDLCNDDAEMIYVGKKSDQHVVPQEDINQLLVSFARTGKQVVRLKGGDPFIFGRGGEEIEQLAAEGIPFEVVPGITAASGCASYAGIPLTHRDHAQSVRFVTGHTKEGELALDWHEMLSPAQTLVFYMGIKSLPLICERLLDAGRDPHTPVAVIRKGTTREQQTVLGHLDNIAKRVADAEIRPPALVIIGSVVELHATLNWFSP